MDILKKDKDYAILLDLFICK